MYQKSDRISFSFIAPAYNNPEQVRKLLDSIRPEFIKDRTLEAIIVDDCSKDGSLKKAVEESGFAKYIRLDKNSGPAEARNAGARAAHNDILVFVDSDVILNGDTLSKIRDRFSGDKSCLIFGGEYDIEPANPSVSTKFKSLMVASWRPKENYVTVFLTRLGAIKRDIFEKMGGFDTKLRTASVEDYEFARRLIGAGYTIQYDPNVTVKHHFPTFRNQPKLFFHRSFMWLYVFKTYGKFDNTCTTPILAVSQLCGFVAVLFLAGSIFSIKLLYASLIFFLLFVLTNLRFFMLTLKYEGFLFMLRSIAMAAVIACSVVAGGIWGTIYFYLYGGKLKKD